MAKGKIFIVDTRETSRGVWKSPAQRESRRNMASDWTQAGLSVAEGKIAAKKEQNTVRVAGARELEGDTARTAWL